MPQFHWHNGTVHDKRGPQPSSHAQEKHRASAVAAQGLHGGIVHHPDGDSKCFAVVETDPAVSEIDRLGNRLVVSKASGIADRYHLVFPVFSKLQNTRHHLPGVHGRARGKLPRLGLSADEGFDAVSTDVNDQDLHRLAPSSRRSPTAGRSISEMPETGPSDYNEPTGFWPVAGLVARGNDPEAVLRLRSSPLITLGRQDESRHRRLRDGRFGTRLRARDAWRRRGNRPCGPEPRPRRGRGQRYLSCSTVRPSTHRAGW